VRRRVAALLLVALLAAPAIARADLAGQLTRGDVALQQGTSVSPADATRLADTAKRLDANGFPVKFALLARDPAHPNVFARNLREAVGFAGTLLVLSPDRLGVSSDRVAPTRLTVVFRHTAAGRPTDQVDGLIQVANVLAASPTAADSGGGGGGGPPWWVIFVAVVGVAAVATGAAIVVARARAARRLQERRAAFEPMLDGLAAHVAALRSAPEDGGERPNEAREQADIAEAAHVDARQQLAAARTEGSVDAVAHELERGLVAAQRAEAAVEGRPAPTPGAPLLDGLCSFDPAHGRAVAAPLLAAPHTPPTPVPASRTCAERIARGQMPPVRAIVLRGRAEPYWAAADEVGGTPWVSAAVAQVLTGGVTRPMPQPTPSGPTAHGQQEAP